MTSYFRTTIGQREQFDRILNQAGFSLEDVKHILADPTLAAKMVAALRTQPLQLAHSIYVQVEQQLFRCQRLGVVITDDQWQSILDQAEHFVPDTDSDAPLVTGGFGYANPSVVANKLFEAFTPPSGYIKRNYISDAELRFVRGMKPTGGLRLVHYDSNTYAGLSPEAAVKAAKKDKVRLAGLEVLERLVLTPEYGLKWGGENIFYPNLSGLERKYEGAWSLVPFVGRWDGSNRKFSFDSGSAGSANDEWSSPVVREC